jgi:putative ABC transport system permease protein
MKRMLRKIRAVVFRRAAERDLEDEIGLHLALETEHLARQGVAETAAAVTARRGFGRIDTVKDALRAIRGVEPVEDLRRDLVFAARALRRRPGFATVVLLTLVIGLTSATTIFGVVYGVLWAPLPYADGDRVVTIYQTDVAHGDENGPVSLPNFLDWRERSRSFTALAVAEPFGVRYRTPEGPERFHAWRVTAGFFETLRASPILGRTFVGDEFRPGRDAVVVLDYDLWRTRFHADSTLVGRALILNDRPVQVVGVMGPGVRFPPGPGLWLPKIPQPDELLLRNQAYFVGVGRLRAGVSLEQARAEMREIARGLALEYPAADRDISVSLVPLRQDLVGHVRARLLLLFASVGLLLLLTAANLTMLLLSRAVERERELWIRITLGAGRGRVVRQLLAENTLLAALGWVISIGFTVLAMRGARTLGAGFLPRIDELRLTPGAVFAAGMALLLAVIPTRSPRKGRRVQQVLVISEVALALLLVIGAGLFVKSVRTLLRVAPGFDPANVLAVTLQTEQLYPKDSARAVFVRTVQDRLSAIPGVQRAGATTALPFGGTIGPALGSFEIVGRPLGPAQARPSVHTAAVMPGYMAAMGIPLRAGRTFQATDDATHPRVAIVSAVFARDYWGPAVPLGQRLSVSFASDPVVYEIVGVVGDVRDGGLEQPSAPELYVPYLQSPTGGVVFVMRTAVPPRTLLTAVRQQIGAVNAAEPIAAVATLDELLAASTRASRVLLAVLGAFASIALVLAGVGIFGVMSHLARTRTQEVSIRLALGASSREILQLILGEAVGLAGIGSIVGLLTAGALGRSVSALLYRVSPLDPATLVAGVTLLIAVASVAAYIPARRAATVDAVHALRG